MSSEENNSAVNPQRQRSTGPMLLAGVGILAALGWMLLKPESEATSSGPEGSGVLGREGSVAGAKRSRLPGGVQSREIDPASRLPKGEGIRRNPALLGGPTQTAPKPPPEEIPEFRSRAEELAFYENRLNIAKQHRARREKFLRYADAERQELEGEGDLDELALREPKWRIVRDNFERAQSKVAELEEKVAELRRQ